MRFSQTSISWGCCELICFVHEQETTRAVEPPLALLKGQSVTSALPDDLPGLVFYSDEKVLYAGPEMIE
jgi:hypothetical protein